MTIETLPPETRVVVEQVCGEGAQYRRVTDRRGCAVWRVTGPAGAAAVKLGVGEEGAAVAGREAEVLAAMRQPGGLLASGRAEGAAWLVTPWYEGPSTWEALRGVREGTADLRQAAGYMVELCEAVGRWHAAGWVHSDLQPGHAIHTAHGVALIDCSWAWHPRWLQASTIFRGGMPHLLAPEVAAAVEDGERPVAPSRPAEVYTLAASLWWAITGAWPLDYAAAGVDPAQLTVEQLRRAIGKGMFRLHSPSVWPGVQRVLAAAVFAQPPQWRPTAAELAVAVRAALLSGPRH